MKFSIAAPKEGSRKLIKIQEMFDKDHHDLIGPGEDRNLGTQSLMQMASLIITLSVSIVGGTKVHFL